MLARVLLFCVASAPAALAADAAADPIAAFEVAYPKESPAGREKLLAELFRAVSSGFPAIQPNGKVTFLYVAQKAERDVRLVGDFLQRNPFTTNWDMRGLPFVRLVPDAPVFLLHRTFEPDARVDYKLVVDGNAQTDPLNRATHDSGIVGPVSELAMPAFRPPLEPLARPEVPRGKLQVIDEPWAQPKVTIYLPPGYDASKRYPTVYTADGSAWQQYVGLPTILNNLIYDGAIEPVIAVMIDPDPERSSWYQFNPEYLAYLEKVVAFVDKTYATRAAPEARLHLGTSAGGRASLYVGLERPALFRNVALLSASLTAPVSVLEPYVTGRRKPDPRLRVIATAGSYEGSIYDDAKWLERTLRKAKVKVTTVYTHQGHSFGHWRSLTAPVLRAVFGTGAPVGHP